MTIMSVPVHVTARQEIGGGALDLAKPKQLEPIDEEPVVKNINLEIAQEAV